MKSTLKIYSILLLPLILWAITPATAHADDTHAGDTRAVDTRAADYYIAISAGNIKYDTSSFNTEAEFDNSDAGSTLALGKNLNNDFSVEVFFAELGQLKFDAEMGDAITREGDTTLFMAEGTLTESTHTIGLAGKKAFTMADRLDGFFKAGLHSWTKKTKTTMSMGDTSHSENDGNDIFWGVGAEYKLNNNMAFFMGFDSYELDAMSLNHTHIGLKYLF